MAKAVVHLTVRKATKGPKKRRKFNKSQEKFVTINNGEIIKSIC